MNRVFSTLLMFAILAPNAALCAEVLVLKSGGKIHGDWLNPDQSPRKSYLFRVAAGGQLTIAGEQVDRVLQLTLAEQRYAKFLPNMPDTIEGQWKMAQWCKKNGLEKQRQTHLEAILKADPEHVEARRGLGFSRRDDRWIKTDEYMREQGFVRYRGSWRLPLDVQREQQKKSVEEVEKKWRHDLKIWRGQIGKRRGAGALERISSVRDPFAAPAMAYLLDNESNPQLKEAYIGALATMNSSVATSALVKHSLEQRDERIRDLCRDALKRRGGRASMHSFIKALSSSENYRVNRAAAALASVGDRNAVLPLIDALVTTHKYKVGGGGAGMTTSFGNGGSGLSTGGNKPKIVTQLYQNRAVLAALVVLTDGANLGYDKAAWRRWYTRSTAPAGLTLRRGE